MTVLWGGFFLKPSTSSSFLCWPNQLDCISFTRSKKRISVISLMSAAGCPLGRERSLRGLLCVNSRDITILKAKVVASDTGYGLSISNLFYLWLWASAITIVPIFVFDVGLGCLCLSLSVPIWSLEMIKSNHDKKSLFNLVPEMKELGMLWEFSYLFCSDSMILAYAPASSVDMEFKEKQWYCVMCWNF